MRHFLVTLEYDGTDFAGWQKQPGLRTVQGELEKALRLISGRDTAVTGAGRTDRGVHAAGQAASFSIPWKSSPDVLANALNAKVPTDIAVTQAWEVPAWTSARRDAVSRRYRYAFLLKPVRSPLLERQAYRVEKKPDIKAMRKAVGMFRGIHDFSAFSRGSDEGGMGRRRITLCTLTRSGPFLYLDIETGGFLRHMVRNIAAAVLGVGLGVIDLGAIRKALSGETTRPPLGMLPACGLTLTRVNYRLQKGGSKSPGSGGEIIPP